VLYRELAHAARFVSSYATATTCALLCTTSGEKKLAENYQPEESVRMPRWRNALPAPQPRAFSPLTFSENERQHHEVHARVSVWARIFTHDPISLLHFSTCFDRRTENLYVKRLTKCQKIHS
jgi:hypothetical protein